MSFGERIRALREDNDETQQEIADLIFVSNKVISDYERGIHFPRDEKAIVILANGMYPKGPNSVYSPPNLLLKL